MSAQISNGAALLAHYDRNEHRDRAIVFVHGLFGSSEGSWSCDRTKSWPEMLQSDTSFRDFDIYLAGYETPVHGGHMTIDEVAVALHNHLEADGVFSQHRDVSFVAHSLGGLVVQRLLLLYPELIPKVKFIYFFSTPETGSGIAQYARIFSSDPTLGELRPGAGNDYLLNLEFSWKGGTAKSIITYCAYETKKFHHVLVVDRLSASRMCPNAPPLPVPKDHISIVKPCSTGDDSYIALLNAVRANPIDPTHENANTTTQPVQNLNQYNFGGQNLQAGIVNLGRPNRTLDLNKFHIAMAGAPLGHVDVIIDNPQDQEMYSFASQILSAADHEHWVYRGFKAPAVFQSFALNGLVIPREGLHCILSEKYESAEAGKRFQLALSTAGAKCDSAPMDFERSVDPAVTMTVLVGRSLE